MRASPLPALVLALVAVAVAAGCAPGAVAQTAMPNGGLDPTPLAKCKVAASHEQPLVTEWPASYKARLEAMLHEGAVAVEYSGCDLRIVDTCRIPGSYAWKKTTLSTDTTDIRDEDDLYAKLPLGAVTLEGQLKTAGSLHVQTTVSGQMQLVGTVGEATSGAECSRATHLVTALSVGAFKLVAGGDVKAGAGALIRRQGSCGGVQRGGPAERVPSHGGDARSGPRTCRWACYAAQAGREQGLGPACSDTSAPTWVVAPGRCALVRAPTRSGPRAAGPAGAGARAPTERWLGPPR